MKNLTFLLILSSLVFINGCNNKIIQSHWKTGDIAIDGNDTDWGNTLIYNDKSNFLYGVQNDDKNLYLCFATNDPDLEANIVRMGLTVWFDRTGGDNQNFGIKYPLNFQDMNFLRTRNDENQPRMRTGNEEPMSAERLKQILSRKQNDLEIVGKNKDDVTRMTVSELKGIEVKMDFQNNTLVYEMKMPLSFSEGISYALNTDTSKTISIGLETGTIDLSKLQGKGGRGGRSMGDDNSGGGMGAGEGDMGGGEQGEGGGNYSGRRRAPQGGAVMSQPFSFWAEVKLASGR
ncbi:MAG: hypothetical protein ACYCVH_04840 [Ignavibacteriaceae bacterium]